MLYPGTCLELKTIKTLDDFIICCCSLSIQGNGVMRLMPWPNGWKHWSSKQCRTPSTVLPLVPFYHTLDCAFKVGRNHRIPSTTTSWQSWSRTARPWSLMMRPNTKHFIFLFRFHLGSDCIHSAPSQGGDSKKKKKGGRKAKKDEEQDEESEADAETAAEDEEDENDEGNEGNGEIEKFLASAEEESDAASEELSPADLVEVPKKNTPKAKSKAAGKAKAKAKAKGRGKGKGRVAASLSRPLLRSLMRRRDSQRTKMRMRRMKMELMMMKMRWRNRRQRNQGKQRPKQNPRRRLQARR